MREKTSQLLVNLLILVAGILFIIWSIKAGKHEILINGSLPFKILAAFISGILYPSFLTAAFSIAIFYFLALTLDPLVVALIAGLGSVVGDLAIVKSFKFLLKKFSFISHEVASLHIQKLLNKFHLAFLTYLVGALIIALPFPDEIGLLMIGATNISYPKLAVLTFILNTAGILLLLLPLSIV